MLREGEEGHGAEAARDKILHVSVHIKINLFNIVYKILCHSFVQLEGDILSNLIELEENKLISSKRRSLDNLIRGGASALSSSPSHRHIPASVILPAKPPPPSK